MNIGIVLIHNKTPAQNEAQISSLKEVLIADFDPLAYTLSNLNNQKFYVLQIVPKNGTVPSNFYALRSLYSVIYGNDQPATTGQFFNWALARACGVRNLDGVIQVEDVSQFTSSNLSSAILRLSQSEILDNESFGKMVTKIFYQNIKDVFDDTKTLEDLLPLYKSRATIKGLRIR